MAAFCDWSQTGGQEAHTSLRTGQSHMGPALWLPLTRDLLQLHGWDDKDSTFLSFLSLLVHD